MMRLVVSATFFPSCGLALGSGELIRRPAADRVFSAVAQQRRVARGMTPSASLAKKVRKVKRNLDMALEEKARADAEL